MMSHKSQTFEILCDSRPAAGNQPLRDRRDSVSPQSQPLRHLPVSQSQNRQLEKNCVDISLQGIHELRRVSSNAHWGVIQKNEKRMGGRLTRPSITPNTFEVLNTAAEPGSQTQSVAADAQRILQLPVNQYSSHPLSIAARDIPSIEEQLAKHRDGLFEWILAIRPPSDSKSQRANSSSARNSTEARKVYFGCNLLPEPSPGKNGPLKTARPTNSYSLLVTSLEETKDVLEVFRDPVHEPGMALPEENSAHSTPVQTSDYASLRGVGERTPNSTVCTRGDDTSPSSMICSSLGDYVTRIEDSFEALDILEDQLEAFDKDARFSQFIPAEKSHSTKECLGKPELATPNLSVRFATPQPQRTFTRPSSALLRVKPATEPQRTTLRKVMSMTFDSPKFKTKEKDLIQLSPITLGTNKATKLNPQRIIAKSTKQPTVPTFELPGEAVARQLKEKREARLASQRATQPTAASLRRAKSVKLPTRPTFELPGEAISRRKREEHQAQLKTQEEEERKRRAFKARPLPSRVVRTTVRETIASRARQNTATLTENSARGSTPNKRPFTTSGSHSRPVLSSTINQAPHRGRGLTMEKSQYLQTSRATSTSTNSLSGKRSSLSIEDVQMQRLRGHEIYQRDNSWNDSRMREKCEREALAKLAREEAAEKSRQKSREWAAKQAKKRMTVGSLRDVIA
ncbi:hypothetical protein F4801DRAFT_399587 [Xylaria longipes]|nr:hypothetical protein F4801DRAFT_399587 [Xylaria longipes]RYC61531.1 hypothetical protein CHU98_g4678 [Xylaria longipes]